MRKERWLLTVTQGEGQAMLRFPEGPTCPFSPLFLYSFRVPGAYLVTLLYAPPPGPMGLVWGVQEPGQVRKQGER